MRFKTWLENNNEKKVLILIHPDCIYELGLEQTKRYTNLLEQHCKQFDYVITHAFLSEQFEDWLTPAKIPDEYKIAVRLIRHTAQKNSHLFLYNSRDLYGCSYAQELPDYLIENDNVTLYMAGGYERNCLLVSYQELIKRLGWLLKEKNIKIQSYGPLVFQTAPEQGLERLGPKNNW
jgi:hypothetical protein